MFLLIKQFVYKITYPRKQVLVYIVESLDQEEALSKVTALYTSAKSIELVGELSGIIPRKG